MRRFPLVIALLLIASSAAGCLGGGDGDVKIPPPDLNTGGDDNNTTLGPLDAPVWEVGQWWGHHTYVGPSDATGSHYNVVVVEAGASGYTVASQSTEHARMDAEEDVFDLGTFGTDLSTTRGGEPWTWYEWPLEHNKTWNQTLSIQDQPYDLMFTATAADDLPSPQGEQEGFRITGTTGDGTVALVYDYQPAMGWFSDLDLFDPQDPEIPIFKVRNMGFGANKTGDYVQVSLVEVVNGTYTPGPGPASDSFEVPEGTATLYGSAEVAVELGQAHLTLTDPEGTTHEYTASAPGGTETFSIDLKDPPSGTWELSFLGLGQDAEATLGLTAVVRTVDAL